jgi:hypothetical protein
MLGIGPLAFAVPWALAALAALPVLWWLLRVTPPAARQVRFPAVSLLLGLSSREDTPAHTPWWVLLLRLLIAAAVILAVAHPIYNPGDRLGGSGPIVVALDDGWAAAPGWPARRTVLNALIDRADREKRQIALLPTAPTADGPPQLIGPLPAAELRGQLHALAPKPWASDRKAAIIALRGLPRTTSLPAIWLSDGLEDDNAGAFAQALQALGGGLEILRPEVSGIARQMLPPRSRVGDTGEFAAMIRHVPVGRDLPLEIRASDDRGRVLARFPVSLVAGTGETQVPLAMPTELRNRVVRVDIDGEADAGSVMLIDERWRRRPVGLVSGASMETDAPLLGDLYYVDKALAPFAEVRKGSVARLMERELAVMMLADVVNLPQDDIDRLQKWMEAGGTLVRFAGPRLSRLLAEQEDQPLLPVKLRAGGRTLGGTLSWTDAQPLAPFAANSPFANISVPQDVVIRAQVLAQPSLDLNDKTWARLADGTPIVTAERRGRGQIVLVHTTANAEWSNLALSGVFVDMLRRVVAVSQGVTAIGEGGRSPDSLAPLDVLDGFGRLVAAPFGTLPLNGTEASRTKPDPRHPPGFYGGPAARVAVNLGPSLPAPRLLAAPDGARVNTYEDLRAEFDAKPWLLAAALVLFLIDMIVGLILRGFLVRRPALVAVLVIAFGLSGQGPEARAAPAGDFATKASLDTRIGYVRTGDSAVDDVSRRGLTSLSELVGRRSTAALGAPMAVDIEQDPILFFPIVYWPVTTSQAPLSQGAVDKLNDYMRKGGLVVFDTRDEGSLSSGDGPAAALRRLVRGLHIPPLAPVTEEHVLTRAFYLLKDLPGRLTGGTVWVERNEAGINDGVSTVLISGNDWAAAWAMDNAGRPLFAAVPGGERQREMAFRFGVNLVMYALTGNYKADQVHLPHIMERLGR